MAKTKTKTYRALRSEPRMAIGNWSANLVQGEELDLTEDVVAALNADPSNPLVEEVDG